MNRTISIMMLYMAVLHLGSCIDTFNIGATEEYGSILVVEGIISNQTTNITLSHSLPINALLTQQYPRVNDAIVTVERSDGTVYRASDEVHDGRYEITTDELAPDMQYRITIECDGQSYMSEFVTPLITPEIETLGFHNDEQERTVWATIETDNSSPESPFFLWTCEEVWESKSQIIPRAGFEDGATSQDKINMVRIEYYDAVTGLIPPYYCWNYNTTYIWGAIDESQKNNKKYLLPIEREGRKMSILYYLKIRQNLIDRDIYNYYSHIQKNSSEMGSIFAPVPSELEGNIKCVSDPSVPVIGIVGASNSTWIETFIPFPNDYHIEPQQLECSGYRSAPPCSGCPPGDAAYEPCIIHRWGWVPFETISCCPGSLNNCTVYDYTLMNDGSIQYIWNFRDCVDCRVWGTKVRPPWWPNDHY